METEPDRSIDAIVRDVIRTHRRRLDCDPDTILVHPDSPHAGKESRGITIIASNSILQNDYHAVRKERECTNP